MKIKNLLSLSLLFACGVGLAACKETTNNNDKEETEEKDDTKKQEQINQMRQNARTTLEEYAAQALATAEKTDDGTVAQAIETAMQSINLLTEQTDVNAAIATAKTQIDNAIAAIQVPLSPTTIWVVGDSTVCDYGKYDANGNKTGVSDSTHFYDRYGYGTQLINYFDNSLVTVKNIAKSGRSSLSFYRDLSTDTNEFVNGKTYYVRDNTVPGAFYEYTGSRTVTDSEVDSPKALGLYEDTSYYQDLINTTTGIKKGDYLVIGFGHNDEKSADYRFASPTESTDTVGSFKYNLYEYYCKVALDKGATPILCSPIVRLSTSNDYTGADGHITETGDYRNTITELGIEKNIPVIDLTTPTKDLYTSLGYDEAIYFHAMSGGLDQNTPKLETVDKTHINIYGAKMVSYMFANALKDSNCSLKDYLVDEINAPTKNVDLVQNPYYEYKSYSTPDLDEWKTTIETGKIVNGVLVESYYDYLKTISEGWYGTVFGDIGGSGMSNGNGWQAKEETEGTFIVGCEKKKGKFGTTEGYAMVFKQIGINDNFTLTADVTVTTAIAADMVTQGGFGIMLRDDIYLYQEAPDGSIKSTAVYAGMYTSSAGTNIVYSRESTTLTTSSATISGVYAQGDTAKLSITRVGQIVTATVVYKDQTYTKTYTDLIFDAIDNEYMYIGMYATRSTVCTFTNVVYTYTGVSQGA